MEVEGVYQWMSRCPCFTSRSTIIPLTIFFLISSDTKDLEQVAAVFVVGLSEPLEIGAGGGKILMAQECLDLGRLGPQVLKDFAGGMAQGGCPSI
jgi:hypothetical protein